LDSSAATSKINISYFKKMVDNNLEFGRMKSRRELTKSGGLASLKLSVKVVRS
jgi:hypothetical protein